ncbi:SET domain-containing protein [Durusdinium trenchii]|uniref:SET domain-containing protein n=1 Tax=Durusdinium trenchii TaxID=1381693 RepID=A0ABP0QXE3_9DINO
MLDAEEALEAELKKLDAALEERRSIQKALKEQDAKRLLAFTATEGNDGVVGPQHWLCDRLWEHLENWNKQAGRWQEELRFLDLRTDYQRKAYFPGPSGTLAWTLEHQADRLLEMLGHGPKYKEVQASQDVKRQMGARLVPILQESSNILRLMFGGSHEYYLAVRAQATNHRPLQQSHSQAAETS